jgi:hypothetical protein
VPPAPAQVSEKVVLAVSAAVLCEPFAGRAPLQPPDAVQDVAFDELQVRVDAAPLLTLVGAALIEAVGGGGGSEVDDPPPPQDVSRASPAAVAKPRIEKCMPYPSNVVRM